MHVSANGRAFIKAHEGEVLKAYRCPAGVWTIGVGLTAASGVVKPKAGMTITREQADRLLTAALERNYELRVRQALPRARQHEFDGGTSFDFNTGAIHKATWAKLWRNKAPSVDVRASICQWVKGGGKVLPGLQRRRREEADVILLDVWPKNLKVAAEPAMPTVAHAAVVISMTDEEIDAAAAGLRKLGYEPGSVSGRIRLEPVLKFQRDHDLEPDGKIGRATISMIQRELDARAATRKTVVTGGGGGAVAGGNEAAASDALLTWIGVGVLALAAVYGLWLAWRYRDVIAARIDKPAPAIARWLRSF